MKGIERRFYEVDAFLRTLMDQNPGSAICAARALAPDEFLDAQNINMLKAGTRAFPEHAVCKSLKLQ